MLEGKTNNSYQNGQSNNNIICFNVYSPIISFTAIDRQQP